MNNIEKVPTQEAQIRLKEQVAYGMGDGATAMLGVVMASFSMYYYTDVMGVQVAAIGTILFVSRFFDAITNIVMGMVVDRTNSKHGKARPWILWTMIPFALSVIVVFSLPASWGPTSSLVFIAITQNLYFLMYTMNNIPYGTLGALLTRDSQIRSNLNIARMLFYFGISLVIPAITLPIINMLGGGARAWQITVIIYALISLAMFTFTFRNTKERVSDAEDGIKSEKIESIPIGKSIKALFTNKYWVLLFLMMLSGWSMLGIMQGTPVYYAEHILNDGSLVGVINAFFTFPLILGFIFVPILLKKFERKTLLTVGMILITIGSLLISLDPRNITIVSIASFFRSLGFSPFMGTAYAMLADTIDYGEWNSGFRNDGLVYSGGTFATTMGGGIASAGIGWLLGTAGYISVSGATQPESVYNMIEFIFIYLPAILGVLMLVLLYFYNLDKEYPTIMKELEDRK